MPRLRFGAAIVSAWGSKPVPQAEQALTVNQALGGRFVPGLGLSHFHMVEGGMGMKFERPIRFLREYLTILMTAMEKGAVYFDGAPDEQTRTFGFLASRSHERAATKTG